MWGFAGAWNLQFYASHTWLWFDSVAGSFDIRSTLTQPFRTIRGKDSGLGFGDLWSSKHSLLLFASCFILWALQRVVFTFLTQSALVLLHVSSYGLCRELCSPSHIACSCSLHFSPCWLCRELYSPSHTAWLNLCQTFTLRGVGKLSSVSPGFTSSKVASLLSQISLCFSLRFSFMLLPPLP
jgi:hypothetical protein